jgi:hypothetical protein
MHKDQNLGENIGKESIKAGYEVTDLNTRVVGMFLIFLAILTIGGMVIIIIVMRGMESARDLGEVSPLAQEDLMLAPLPNLQGDPRADKDAAIAEANARLGSYGWVSEDPGVRRAHIPIEEAMKIIAQEHVPYKQAPVMAAESPVIPAADGATEERPTVPTADATGTAVNN